MKPWDEALGAGVRGSHPKIAENAILGWGTLGCFSGSHRIRAGAASADLERYFGDSKALPTQRLEVAATVAPLELHLISANLGRS